LAAQTEDGSFRLAGRSTVRPKAKPATTGDDCASRRRDAQLSIHDDPRYEWNPAKARANARAHGVDFVEAASALEDPQGLTREDPDAAGERRYATLGMTRRGRLVVVIRTQRGRRIRLISAWKASARQRDTYAQDQG